MGSHWVQLDRRPTRLAQVPPGSEGARELACDLARGKLSFSEEDMSYWKGLPELTLRSYVETEGGAFFKPVAGAVDCARVAASKGRGQGAAVLELLQCRAAEAAAAAKEDQGGGDVEVS